MKGDYSPELLIFSVFMVLFVCACVLSASGKMFGEKSLLEKFSDPVTWGSEELIKAAAGDFLERIGKFSDEVGSIFGRTELRSKCNQWYKECSGNSDTPWTNPDIKYSSDQKIFEAISALESVCGTGIQEEMAKKWSAGNSRFAGCDAEAKYNLMKNACASDLVSQVKEARDNYGGW
ncbi:MAG: hypothetical protein ACP5E4_02925 [Candidatus Aenigmatarchaeota archaeon]